MEEDAKVLFPAPRVEDDDYWEEWMAGCGPNRHRTKTKRKGRP